MKLRLLNGAHSMIAYLGQLKGLEYVRDVMAVPEYRDLARRHMKSAVRTLDPVPGIELNRYIDQLIARRSEEHTSELQSLMRISYAVFCLQKKRHRTSTTHT